MGDMKDKEKKFTWPGLIVTLLALIGMGWGLWHLVFWEGSPFSGSEASRLSNAKQAFSRLSQIRDAQESYKKETGRFARFFIHLYREPDAEGKPVDRGLIPQRLGFARSPKTDWDGYYYVDAHKCGAGDKDRRVPETEWMAAAVPAQPGKTGDITLLASPEGIFAASDPGAMLFYPCNPRGPDWTRVEKAGDLAGVPRTGR